MLMIETTSGNCCNSEVVKTGPGYLRTEDGGLTVFAPGGDGCAAQTEIWAFCIEAENEIPLEIDKKSMLCSWKEGDCWCAQRDVFEKSYSVIISGDKLRRLIRETFTLSKSGIC